MRLTGSYQIRSQPIAQEDLQIKPTNFQQFEGWEVPVGGPFTLVKSERGTAILYVSCPGETPLYYVAQPKILYWSEQRFDLPVGAKKVNPGEIVIWEPNYITTQQIDFFPQPKIREDYPLEQAYAEYGSLILRSLLRRLETCANPERVAVAQSGGLDSLLITWALHTLGVEVVPITVCTSPQDLDITAAQSCLEAWGLKPIPVQVTTENIPELLTQALRCTEDTETSNLRMAMGNILIARKCQDLGIETIFAGHGHDDIHGKGTLVKPAFQKAAGASTAEKWANARAAVTLATGGMLKMFASSFRNFGVRVRLPYYDRELLGWTLNQPTSIIPVTFDKSFVRGYAHHVLPPGEWLAKKHSIGYLTGSGLSLKQPLLKTHPLLTPQSLSQLLQQVKHGQN